MGSLRWAGPKIGLAWLVIANCDWWHGQSRRLVCCSYRLAGQPACVQILEYATKLCHWEFLLISLAFFSVSSASGSRRRISSVGESAYLLVAPFGMPGNTVIWP